MARKTGRIVRLGVYFDWPSEISRFTRWLFYTWRINANDRGYYRLGKYRERGVRILGVNLMRFDSLASKRTYEEQNGKEDIHGETNQEN